MSRQHATSHHVPTTHRRLRLASCTLLHWRVARRRCCCSICSCPSCCYCLICRCCLSACRRRLRCSCLAVGATLSGCSCLRARLHARSGRLQQAPTKCHQTGEPQPAAEAAAAKPTPPGAQSCLNATHTRTVMGNSSGRRASASRAACGSCSSGCWSSTAAASRSCCALGTCGDG